MFPRSFSSSLRLCLVVLALVAIHRSCRYPASGRSHPDAGSSLKPGGFRVL